jgi:hypothetical protein
MSPQNSHGLKVSLDASPAAGVGTGNYHYFGKRHKKASLMFYNKLKKPSDPGEAGSDGFLHLRKPLLA